MELCTVATAIRLKSGLEMRVDCFHRLGGAVSSLCMSGKAFGDNAEGAQHRPKKSDAMTEVERW